MNTFTFTDDELEMIKINLEIAMFSMNDDGNNESADFYNHLLHKLTPDNTCDKDCKVYGCRNQDDDE